VAVCVLEDSCRDIWTLDKAMWDLGPAAYYSRKVKISLLVAPGIESRA
jgi:hypothetical protein